MSDADKTPVLPLGAFLRLMVLEPDEVSPERIPEVYAALDAADLGELDEDTRALAQAALAVREEEARQHLGPERWLALGDALAGMFDGSPGELAARSRLSTLDAAAAAASASAGAARAAKAAPGFFSTYRSHLAAVALSGVGAAMFLTHLGNPPVTRLLGEVHTELAQGDRRPAPAAADVPSGGLGAGGEAAPSTSGPRDRRMILPSLEADTGDVEGGEAGVGAALTMQDPQGQDLVLEDLDVRLAAHGPVALTELEMVFRNLHGRQMEGRFTYTLPSGATISRFAKEVDGRLMEGEVVERLKATRVYTEILHQMRDPALLQQDQGNRFDARVFPIPANGTVRLLLSYSSVNPLGADGVRRWTVPLRGVQQVDRFRFRGVVRPLPGETVIARGWLRDVVTGVKKGDEVVLDHAAARRDFTPGGDLRLAVEADPAVAASHVVEAGGFRMVTHRAAGTGAVEGLLPDEWIFFVDTSASGVEAASYRLQALAEVLRAVEDLSNGRGVRVFSFDDRVRPVGSWTAGEPGRQGAIDALEAQQFLGATDLARALGAMASDARESGGVRNYVLVSDAIPTLGAREAGDLARALGEWPEGARLHVLNLGSTRDARVAEALSSAGRGRVVELPLTTAFARHSRRVAHELVRAPGDTVKVAAAGAAWVEPSVFEDVQPGQEVVAFVRNGEVKPGPITVTPLGAAALTLDAEPTVVPAFGPLLEREAYRAEMARLERLEDGTTDAKARAALRAQRLKISTEHRVLCPLTAMLVLETEEDYDRYEIDRRALVDILGVGEDGIVNVRGKRRAYRRPDPEPEDEPALQPVIDPDAKVRFVVAARTIPAGARLEADMLRVLEVPLRAAPWATASERAGYTRQVSEVVGQYAQREMGEREAVLTASLGRRPPAPPRADPDQDRPLLKALDASKLRPKGTMAKASATPGSPPAEAPSDGLFDEGFDSTDPVPASDTWRDEPETEEDSDDLGGDLGIAAAPAEDAPSDGYGGDLGEDSFGDSPDDFEGGDGLGGGGYDAASAADVDAPVGRALGDRDARPRPTSGASYMGFLDDEDSAGAPTPDAAPAPPPPPPARPAAPARAGAPLLERSLSRNQALREVPRTLASSGPRAGGEASTSSTEVAAESVDQLREEFQRRRRALRSQQEARALRPLRQLQARAAARQDIARDREQGRRMPPRPGSAPPRPEPVEEKNEAPRLTLPPWVVQGLARPDGDAMASALEAVAKAPKDRAARNRLCDLLRRTERWAALAKQAREWLPFDVRNPMVYEFLGRAYEGMGEPELARRAFASIAEVAPGDSGLLNRAAFLLLRLGALDAAEDLFRVAIERRPEHQNNYRGLGLALWMQGRHEDALVTYVEALEVDYHSRYESVREVLKEEAAWIARAWSPGKGEGARRDRLLSKLGLGPDVELADDALRVTLHWETDANDVDLHVVDPAGEECYYSYTETASGLVLKDDLTQGLGPEVIATPRGSRLDGTYHVGVKYFRAGPMGVSRGVVVILEPGAEPTPRVRIEAFALLPEDGRPKRLVASVRAEGAVPAKAVAPAEVPAKAAAPVDGPAEVAAPVADF